jgi:ABC-type transport system involved in Fe-S cluster assembly fused permease/ATPase subunit
MRLKYDYAKQKDSGLNFLKDTNIIQNLIWSLCLGMMVAISARVCNTKQRALENQILDQDYIFLPQIHTIIGLF